MSAENDTPDPRSHPDRLYPVDRDTFRVIATQPGVNTETLLTGTRDTLASLDRLQAANLIVAGRPKGCDLSAQPWRAMWRVDRVTVPYSIFAPAGEKLAGALAAYDAYAREVMGQPTHAEAVAGCEHRRILMPDVVDFADVLDYVREWDSATMTHRAGVLPRPDLVPAPRIVPGLPDAPDFGPTEVGPYCSVDLSQLGGERHRGIAVTATDATMAVLAPQVSSDDVWSFGVIGHRESGYALLTASANRIIASRWLAYVDPTTIPGVDHAVATEGN